MARRVSVIGAGVIGLSVAYELARHGDHVEVVADVDTMQTVSAVSAALWFPYRSERSAAADALLTSSLARFASLAEQPETGVRWRRGTVVERRANTDRSWTSLLDHVEEAPAHLLPAGATSGVRVALPMIVIPKYLAWLRAELLDRGVRFVTRTVASLGEFIGHADVVVIAAGVRGGELLGGDRAIVPVRGQIVRLRNPGLHEWITDDENPSGLTYVLPRDDDVVIGGTAVEGDWDLGIRTDVEAAILARARQLVPALENQPVIGRATGLRPGRSSVRIERVKDAPVTTIAAYGHGGAGVTLSWGTAEHVREICVP